MMVRARWIVVVVVVVGCGDNLTLPPEEPPTRACDYCARPTSTVPGRATTTARPLSPLSTATTTSRRPTLRWTGTDAAHVELCRDRACTTVIEAIDATGGS